MSDLSIIKLKFLIILANKKLETDMKILLLLLSPLLLFSSEFVEFDIKNFPEVKNLSPQPPRAYPDGTTESAFENHGNHWALVPSKTNKNQHSLMVLPANEPSEWQVEALSGVKDGKWKHLQAGRRGFIWLSDGDQVLRINVKKPHEGAVLISADSQFPADKITAMGMGQNGHMLLALKGGNLVEVQRVYNKKLKRHSNIIKIIDAPKNILKIHCDRNGALWLKSKQKSYKKDALPNAWQHNWEESYQLPGGSHDLSGDVLDGKFYMSWAISGDFGYPSEGNFHRNILKFDPSSGWSIFADYGYPRGYGGTSYLDGKIWAIGGDALDKDKKRFNTLETQVFDSNNGDLLKTGPKLPVGIPACISFNIKDRLYALGYPSGKDLPLKIFSLGKNDNQWLTEKDGTIGAGSSYGTVLNDIIYTVLDRGELAIYDTRNKTWKTSPIPNKTRSPAVGHFKGEIWVMGGRNSLSEAATHIYNPKTTQWRRGPDLPLEMSWGCAFNIDGKMYITGGASYSSGYNHRTFMLRDHVD